jgi:hypothetical protein
MSRFPPVHRVARSALLAGQAAPSAWSPPVLWVVPGGMTERMTGALPSPLVATKACPASPRPSMTAGWCAALRNHNGQLLEISQAGTAG